MNRSRVAAIVPAYNESRRVASVLDAISGSGSVDEIFVVTDGCTDDTAQQVRLWIEQRVAATPEVRLFELTENIGKGGAMTYGAHRTDAEVLLFLDADLIGLRSAQVDEMLEPMLREHDPASMTLGLFGAVRGGVLGWWLGWCHRLTPAITGQRAILRQVFLEVPELTHSRYGVEAAITRHVHCSPDLLVDYAYLHNVTHPIKEEKLGPWRGFATRLKMYREIGTYLARANLMQTVAQYREKASSLRGRFEDK